MQLSFRTFIFIGMVIAAACTEEPLGENADGNGTMGVVGTGGTAGVSGVIDTGGAGEISTGGSGVIDTGGAGEISTGGGSGSISTGGTQDVIDPGLAGAGSQDDGVVTDTGGTGGTDVLVTGGVGLAAGTGGFFDNGGNNFIRGPEPTVDSATTDGPYTVESYMSGFSVGPSFPGGTVWYPNDAEPPFAGIAIVPGFMMPRATIEGWGPFLASHGIVAFTIDTNTVSDSPTLRSRALLNALESLKAENTRADSPLVGKLDNQRQAVGGWSMGGGGTLITINANPQLKAGIGMCSYSPGTSFSRNQVPTLLFASAGDPLAGGQSQGFYRSIPDTTPKMLFEWGVGDHFMANAPTGATGQVGRYGLSWLKVFLEGDERYRQFIEQPCEGCSDFQSNL